MLLRSRGARMYRVPIHFGALCKSTYDRTTRPRQNRQGRQNVRLYLHRGAAAKMFHFSFTVITCFSHIFFFSLFSVFLFSLLGPSIKYVTLFLMIFDPPVTNCHKSWTPQKKYVTLLGPPDVLAKYIRLRFLYVMSVGHYYRNSWEIFWWKNYCFKSKFTQLIYNMKCEEMLKI